MPFGVTNAPAQFMNMVQDLLSDMVDQFVIVFIDDILIFSKDVKEHTEHVKKVLARLREHKLFAKASKCEVAVEKVEFLGQQISGRGVTPQESKVKAIREWVVPKTVKEVRSFLGMASYYRQFIDKFAKLAAPLHDLMKKDVGYFWTSRQQKAFEDLKHALTTAPVLILPDPAKPYVAVSDASDTAIGGVLLQDHGAGL